MVKLKFENGKTNLDGGILPLQQVSVMKKRGGGLVKP